MGKNSLRRLAGELKTFLQEQAEDELINISAAPAQPAAAGVSRRVQTASKPPQATLTIDFPRAQTSKKSAPVEVPQNQPVAQSPVMTTAQKQAALAQLAETIKHCSRCPLG
ncbi:MAG: hypothetical protein IKO35_00020, partial [Elusimicrobiaceae bacterium]|nr:hypothetical protein [Elusimicrobiaceae bacterium]